MAGSILSDFIAEPHLLAYLDRRGADRHKRLSAKEQTRVRLCTPCKIRLALLRGSPTGRAKSSMPLTPSSSSSSSSSVAPLEGDPSRKDDVEGGGGWRWGGAPSPMAPFGAPGAPRGGHARISSAAPHAPRRVYSGDCGGGGGVRGCGCAIVGGGIFGGGRTTVPPLPTGGRRGRGQHHHY